VRSPRRIPETECSTDRMGGEREGRIVEDRTPSSERTSASRVGKHSRDAAGQQEGGVSLYPAQARFTPAHGPREYGERQILLDPRGKKGSSELKAGTFKSDIALLGKKREAHKDPEKGAPRKNEGIPYEREGSGKGLA